MRARLVTCQRLDLSLLERLGSASAAAVAGATGLEWLSLRNCRKMGNADVAHILQSCPRVSTLS
jgi:O-acetylhomoserine/O-acetylserine sulfhydrylase-like pyridoxal-dependent enzyme